MKQVQIMSLHSIRQQNKKERYCTSRGANERQLLCELKGLAVTGKWSMKEMDEYPPEEVCWQTGERSYRWCHNAAGGEDEGGQWVMVHSAAMVSSSITKDNHESIVAAQGNKSGWCLNELTERLWCHKELEWVWLGHTAVPLSSDQKPLLPPDLTNVQQDEKEKRIQFTEKLRNDLPLHIHAHTYTCTHTHTAFHCQILYTVLWPSTVCHIYILLLSLRAKYYYIYTFSHKARSKVQH